MIKTNSLRVREIQDCIIVKSTRKSGSLHALTIHGPNRRWDWGGGNRGRARERIQYHLTSNEFRENSWEEGGGANTYSRSNRKNFWQEKWSQKRERLNISREYVINRHPMKQLSSQKPQRTLTFRRQKSTTVYTKKIEYTHCNQAFQASLKKFMSAFIQLSSLVSFHSLDLDLITIKSIPLFKKSTINN